MGWGTPTVSTGASSSATTNPSLTVSLAGTVQVGDAVAVAVTIRTNSGLSGISCTDNGSNSYALLNGTQQLTGTETFVALFVCKHAENNATTLTISSTTSGTAAIAAVIGDFPPSFTGGAVGVAVDLSAGWATTTSTFSRSLGTPSNPNDLVIGVYGTQSNTVPSAGDATFDPTGGSDFPTTTNASESCSVTGRSSQATLAWGYDIDGTYAIKFDVTLSGSQAGADQVTSLFPLIEAPTDNAGTSDGVTAGFSFFRTPSDSGATADSVAEYVTTTRAIADDCGQFDSAAANVSVGGIGSDAAVTADVALHSTSSNPVTDDALSDDTVTPITATVSESRTPADAAATADSVTQQLLSIARSAGDNDAAVDVPNHHRISTPSDSAATADLATRTEPFTRAVSEFAVTFDFAFPGTVHGACVEIAVFPHAFVHCSGIPAMSSGCGVLLDATVEGAALVRDTVGAKAVSC